MWRDETGIFEMLFSYIGEYEQFNSWLSWRNLLVEILSCHEHFRQGSLLPVDPEKTEIIGKTLCNDNKEIVKRDPEEAEAEAVSASMERELCDYGSYADNGDLLTQLPMENVDNKTECVSDDEVEIINEPTTSGATATRRTKRRLLSDTNEWNIRQNDWQRRFHEADLTSNVNDRSTVDFVPLLTGTRTTNVCHLCGKSYSDKSTLKRHYRIHNGHRPYTCQYCEKTFYQRSDLKKHLPSHTGERPFLCQLCGKAFPINSRLRCHMRQKHNVFE